MSRTLALLAAGALAVALAGCSAAPASSYSDYSEPDDVVQDEAASEPAAEAPEEAPPADTDPFAIGSDFSQSCSIAWPSAPVVTSSAIQLTLQCSGVPSDQYQLVVAVYPDPDLPVTPSTGSMQVSGTVADVGTSGSGLVYLVVQASAVDF